MSNPFIESAFKAGRKVQEKTQSLNTVLTESTRDVDPMNLGNFLSWVRSAGLQKTNRFFVDIAFPRKMNGVTNGELRNQLALRRDILLACEEINVPPRSIQTRTQRLNGLNERRANTLDYGGDFTLTFLVDNTHEVQAFFERWLNIEVDQTTREVGEYPDYATTVDLWFLRPYSATETYNALSRYQTGVNRFLTEAKNRITNLAAAEVGRFKTRLKNAFDTKKRDILGSNIDVYNRIKSVLPLELITSNEPTDYAMYRLSFKEAFPVMITRSVMSQGGTDVMRITVQFAFKEYTTEETGLERAGPDENMIFNFIKRVGIPTSKSGLARAAINLL